MNLAKLSIATGVAALLLSSSVFAAHPGAFVGLNVGYGDTHNPSEPHLTLKNTGFAYGINGGYNINNYFGVEAQFNKDASTTYKNPSQEDFNSTTKFYDIDLLADGYLPLGNSFDLVGKAGVAYVRSANKNGSDSESHHKYRPKLAVGFDYNVTDNVVVGATYSRIFKTGKIDDGHYIPNIDVAAVSLDYSFSE